VNLFKMKSSVNISFACVIDGITYNDSVKELACWSLVKNW
jgi:hypothetical protein